MRDQIGKVAMFIGALCLAVSAQATTFKVDGIWNGTGGGFGASLFHDLDYGPMGGHNLGRLQSNATGSFNSDTGVLDLFIGVNGPGTSTEIATAHLTGNNLFFDANGWLSSVATIAVDITSGALSSLPGGNDFTLTYAPGPQCCGGNGNDPNSLRPSPGGIPWLTLWGSTAYDGTFHSAQNWSGDAIGLDLRVELTQMPVPAAVWLFGSALFGLMGLKRYQRT